MLGVFQLSSSAVPVTALPLATPRGPGLELIFSGKATRNDILGTRVSLTLPGTKNLAGQIGASTEVGYSPNVGDTAFRMVAALKKLIAAENKGYIAAVENRGGGIYALKLVPGFSLVR